MATETASSLQKVSRMKRLTVGILAALLLGGCGVGAHDPEGEAAAGWAPPAKRSTQEQSQEMAAAGGVTRTEDPTPPADQARPATVLPTNPRASGLEVTFDRRKALPQDPIPISPEGEGMPAGGEDTQDPVQ